jgi:hypothetical protein
MSTIIYSLERLKQNYDYLKNALYTRYSLYRDLILYFIRLKVMDKLGCGKLSTSNKYYEVSYFNGPTKYTIRFQKKIGVCPYISVTCKDLDVTEKIKEYAGPTHNFHGITVTPASLGYNDPLTFYYRDGTTKTFLLNEKITL